MDRTLFETRAISFFSDQKYAFFDDVQQGDALKQMPFSHYLGIAAMASVLGSRTWPSIILDSKVKSEVVKLGELCDFIGVKVSDGAVGLALFVYSDDLTDETIVGKCHLIHQKLPQFKEYTMRIGWTKLPVYANVFFVFSNSDKAFHFRTTVQEHCKHRTPFSFCKLSVLPWGIDLAANSVWAYEGLPSKSFKAMEIEKVLFS